MLRWKLVMCALALQNALGQDVKQGHEKELNGDSKYLNMSARGLEQMLDLNAFANLEIADFSYNAITELQWARIANAPRLKTLDLSENDALILPVVGPCKVLPLSTLNMSFCHVDVIAKDALNGLANLEVLDLRGNAIFFEESPVFEQLQAPPKRLIVSQITKNELDYICKNVDMLVEIIDDDMTFECKDVRRKQRGAVSSSPDSERIRKDYIVDGLMPSDTHMEMLADQPTEEGSGDDGQDVPPLSHVSDQDVPPLIPGSDQNIPPLIPAPDQNIPPLIHASGNQTEEQQSEKPMENEEELIRTTDKQTDTSTEEEQSEEAAASKEHTIPTDMTATSVEKEDISDETKHDIFEKKGESGEIASVESSPMSFPEITESDGGKIKSSMIDPNHKAHENHETHEIKESNVLPRQRAPTNTLVRKNSIDIHTAGEESKDPVPIGENKAAQQSDTGKKVILVLVIGAAVMGSVFGLMKVYKDRKRNAMQEGAPCEGQEMNVFIAERKPLIDAPAANGQPKADGGAAAAAVDENCPMVVVEEDARNGDAMTAKEILADAVNTAGLPDIDDASRLSTIIVSTINLEEAK